MLGSQIPVMLLGAWMSSSDSGAGAGVTAVVVPGGSGGGAGRAGVVVEEAGVPEGSAVVVGTGVA